MQTGEATIKLVNFRPSVARRSILGVLIFVGLTAYDTQKIKNMYAVSDSGEIMGKKAVMGALTLYLDFINLFIMLLRLFGQRR